MKKLFYVSFFLCLCLSAFSQLSTNQLLRLHNIANLTDLGAISSPQAGQLAFVVSENTTYQYNGTAWVTFGGGTSGTSTTSIIDQDGDTWIKVDDGADNDMIDFTTEGTHHFRMDEEHLEVLNSGHCIFIGEGAGSVNTGDLSTSVGVRNIAIGNDAWTSMSGNDNVAIGHKVLNISTSVFPPSRCVGVGSQSLQNNFGSNNTAIGYRSLQTNIGGSNNVAIGTNALRSNTNGIENCAIGVDALLSNTNGVNNVAVGKEALKSNVTGQRNTAVGFQSLISNVVGHFNSALGFHALNKNTGSGNSAFGERSLEENTSGINNSAFGSTSLRNNTTGGENSAFGIASMHNNQTGSDNVAFGRESLHENTNGSNNCAIGAYALYASKGNNNIGLGDEAEVANSLASNQVRIGNPSTNHAAIQVSWSITSDLHWKENVRDLPYGLNLINRLRPVDYLRKNAPNRGREVGFIAQELAEVLKEVGFDDQGFLTQTDKGHYEVRYNDFIPIAIRGIQEQQKEIEELKSKYIQLLERLENLENSTD